MADIKSVVDQAVKGVDPFAEARRKQNTLLDTSQAFDPNTPGPLEASPIPNTTEDPLQSPQEAATEVLSQSLMPEPTNKQTQELNASGFATFLQGQGLGDLASGLSLTPMGRLQLIGRLKVKFGDNFLQTSQGKKVVDMFESAMEANQKSASKKQDKYAAQISRTLDILGVKS